MLDWNRTSSTGWRIALRQGGVGGGEQPRHLPGHADRRARPGHRRQGAGPADRPRRREAADRPADRGRRQSAAGARQDPQLALLDLRPRRLHPARGASASRSASTYGHIKGPQGQGLFKAVDYLLPAATGAAAWPHPELEFHRYAASDVVHAAADAGDRARAAPRLQAPPGGDLGAAPAAEQLDSIAGWALQSGFG